MQLCTPLYMVAYHFLGVKGGLLSTSFTNVWESVFFIQMLISQKKLSNFFVECFDFSLEKDYNTNYDLLLARLLFLFLLAFAKIIILGFHLGIYIHN